MADYGFGGSDEENAELKKLNTEVVRILKRSSLILRFELMTDILVA